MFKIKRKKEFVLAAIMIVISAFLMLYDGIIINLPAVDRGGYWNRPDVWIRFWALLLLIDSVAVLIRTIVREPEGEEEKPFYIDLTIILIAASLLLYIFLLPAIGFIPSTFLIVLFLNMMFVIREEGKHLKDIVAMDKKDLLIKLGKSVLYSVIMVIALYFVFAKGLNVVFPS